MSQLIIDLAYVVLSLTIITLAASYIIKAVTNYAKSTGISDYLVGFLIVSMGTSLPELTTAFVASVNNAGNLVLGDLIGASILDVTIVLGLTSIVGRRIFIKGNILKETLLTVIVMAMLPLLLGFDGTFTRIDGILLVIAYFLYLLLLLRKEGKFGHLNSDLKWDDIRQDMMIIVAGIISLLIGAQLFVRSAIDIANLLHVPYFIIGLVLVAFCTTLPELIVELMSVMRGSTGIAFGDILGSVVTNCSLILGIAAIINDIVVDRGPFINAAFFMVTAVFISLLFIKKKEISWQEGLGLLMIYVTFLVSEGLSGLF